MIIQLNNHNLSPNTYRVTLKQNVTLYDLNQKIEKTDLLNNVQVHYQDCENKNVTFLRQGQLHRSTDAFRALFFGQRL